MARTVLILAIVALAFVFSGSVPAGDAKKKSLEGDWVIIAMAKNGAVAPPKAIDAAFIRATATTFVAVDKSTKVEVPNSKLTYEFVGPKDIDFYAIKEVVGGKEEPGTAPPIKIFCPGIFEFKGDTLKLCWRESLPGLKDASGKIIVPEQRAPRPTDFEGSPGQYSITLTRKAK